MGTGSGGSRTVPIGGHFGCFAIKAFFTAYYLTDRIQQDHLTRFQNIEMRKGQWHIGILRTGQPNPHVCADVCVSQTKIVPIGDETDACCASRCPQQPIRSRE
ncbi:hypothetical protein TWF718_000299 [Orbilia javanica]|uniref:Uncharacterized protein n=1 Tax=Orbilia javanica TaxID=47235 RepID=A0AAN8RRI1_9PEZI